MFENESKNNLENNLKVVLRNVRVLRIIIAVIAPIALALGLLALLSELLDPSETAPDYLSGAVMLALGVFLLAYFIFYKPFLRRALKKTMQGKEGVNLYRFSEEGYEIATTLSDGTTGTTQGNYFAFTLCKEFSGFWLLYLNKATYFIVEKSGMKTGTAEELTGFLIGKLGGKYKVCYKKK